MKHSVLLGVAVCLLVLGHNAPAQESATAELTVKPRVKMETSLGDIVIELDGEKAPISTLNFLRYAQEGFYEGTIFHRVISNFMIQGGGFTRDMDEKKEGLHPPIKNEWKNGLKNTRGTIAMARTQVADSATSQFYINVVDNPFLDQPQPDAAYAVFGRVVDGMDTVDAIKDTPVETHPKYPGQPVTPVTPVVIKAVTLLDAFDQAAVEAKVAAMEQAEAEAAAKKEAENQKLMQELIAKTEAETGKKFTTTASGLMVLVLEEGSGDSPRPSDTVEVHYRGTLLDGREFDSSYARNQTVSFPLNQVIKGWTEGVGMMKVGGKSKFIIPPHLAYGDRAMGDMIEPNSTLVFDVELISIR